MLNFDMTEKSSWEYIADSGKPVVVYGMGNGADKVIDEFNRIGVKILGVTASDDFVRGQSFRGYEVKKLSEFKDDFILAPAFGSSRSEVIEHIITLNDCYDLVFPVVPVVGNEIFNRSFIERYEDKIKEASDLFSGRSREVYENCIRFLYSGRLEFLISSTDEKDEIFKDYLSFGGSETFLDLGAYRGDTVDEFLSYTDGKYRKIIAVEPDIKTFKKLEERFRECDNVILVNKAVCSQEGYVFFESDGGRQSHISSLGKKAECTTIDRLCTDTEISYIKIDIEGLEYEALSGGINTLKTKKPKLNIALYHRSQDIFEIPLYVKSLNPDYSMEIRKHPYVPCWDLNLYCR